MMYKNKVKVKGIVMRRLLILQMISLLALTACSKNDENIVQGYIEGELVYLSSSQAGSLAVLNAKRGDAVNAEKVLFQLNSQPETDELAQSAAMLANTQATLQDVSLGLRPEEMQEIEADIEATQAAITYYQAQMHRYEQLAKQDYAAKADYDQAIFQYNTNTATLKRLRAQLSLGAQGQRPYQIQAKNQTVQASSANVAVAQWKLAQKTVASGISGVVFDTYYKVGEWVDSGKPVLSVQAPQNIDLIFFVSEAQLGKIHVGDQVSFQCDACKNPTSAVINYIASSAEYTPPVIYSEDMRSKLVYEVRAHIADHVAMQYHPGQPVDVAINGKF
jgi:HlyD family secretion protein